MLQVLLSTLTDTMITVIIKYINKLITNATLIYYGTTDILATLLHSLKYVTDFHLALDVAMVNSHETVCCINS